VRPTGRCAAAFAAGLLAAAWPALVPSAGAALVWLTFLGVFGMALAIELLLLPARRGVAIAVDAPAAVHFGDAAVLTVTATASRRVVVDVEIELVGAAEPLAPACLTVAPDAPAQATLPLRPSRRGTMTLAVVHARWTGPLGLLWCETAMRLDRTIAVIANVRAVRARTARMVSNREFVTGLKVEKYLGDGSDFDSLREFVVGMDRRSIDWKATARHREVLCREYRAERDHPVMVCVDTGRLMGEPLHGMPRLDHAMLAALQLAYVCLRTGDRVGLFAFADKPQQTILPRAGVPALHAIQERLTGLDYSATETNYTLAMTELLRQLRRRTLVVLFTDFVDSITAELMLRNVTWLAQKHLLLFVAMRDPLPAEIAARDLHHVEDLHRAVVAEEVRRERLLVLERIRAAGAQVLDTEVAKLDTELIQRYLQVKRRELL
jgi:uncharacterized protein (DUF58 family)